MFSILNRRGYEMFRISGVRKAMRLAYRYSQRTGKPVRVVNSETGSFIAEF